MFQNPKSTYPLALGWNLLEIRGDLRAMSGMSVLILGLEINFAEHRCPDCCALHFLVLLFYCLISLEVYLCGNLVRVILLLGLGFASLLHSSPVALEGPFQWHFCTIWPSWAGCTCVSFPLPGSLGICDDPVSNFLLSVLSFGKLSWKWTSFSKKSCHVCL